ncbi:unnamed protein product [Cuscuta epithymum]|uniref:Uncharacterized protein n=1 Tax=Cuscuta epithymum TaxID=186058 RepID=A0AAV0C6Q5_9ASTE|nr:unnamed protein product [Cuscuta epithymum]
MKRQMDDDCPQQVTKDPKLIKLSKPLPRTDHHPLNGVDEQAVAPPPPSNVNAAGVVLPRQIRMSRGNIRANSRAKVCAFYVPDDWKSYGGDVFALALDKAAETSDDLCLCTNVACVLRIVLPDLKDELLNALYQLGVSPMVVSIPSQADEHLITFDDIPEYDWPNILVRGAFCIFTLFRTVSPAHYTQCMLKRFEALKSIVGCVPNAEIPIPLNQSKASILRMKLGSNRALIKRTIELILGFKNGYQSIASVMRYVAKILSYNVRDDFTFIYYTFGKYESPVLSDPRVEQEVVKLEEALELMKDSDYPQFTRYLASTADLFKLEGSRFPTLMSVAQKIKAEEQRSGVLSGSETNHYQFVLSKSFGADKDLVKDLCRIHSAGMAEKQRSMVEWLTTDLEDF